MDNRKKRIERFKQTRLETLTTNEPACHTCPETHFACFEKHHLAGQRYSEETVLECKNCHAKLTALQKGHGPSVKGEPSWEEVIGRFLMGLADFFEILIETLRKYGDQLIEHAGSNKNGGAAGAGTA